MQSISIYASNNRASKYSRQKLKGKVTSTITVGGFSTLFLVFDKKEDRK